MTGDIPVPLAEAVKLFFPHGGATVSSLRTEARKGRLDIMRVAGRDFTTGRAIREMLQRCQIERKAQDFTSATEKAGNPSGQSLEAKRKLAQDALSVICKELKKPLPGGLRRTRGRTPNNVISIKSQ